MTNRFYLFALAISALMAGCGGQETKKPAAPTSPKKPELMAPFRFHKLIEVSPGQSYDILSWGRGAEEAGSFMILHSDSSAIKYTTTTGDLDGAIIDVYNSDMDVDGNPEILIQAKSKDTTNYTSIYAFEFNDNNSKANKLDFPKLTSSQRKGYRGNDDFYIKEGKLMREFPIFNGTGKDAKPSGAKRQLEYGLRGNEFTVKQLSKDSTDVKQPDNRPAKTDEKKSSDKQRSSSSSKSSKKKHKRHRG
ncbi:hypothetical protein DIU31_010225 [Mucilaginibacter rubeus]|uniref:PliI/PliC-like inhibitor of I-type lysozyme n=1 Tax=Mucilaginibacter rubeus TaxID=2027860 RepID=A0AAE6JF18_9SPHI|nr:MULTISPECIES: hypothetical protein [Mucilaginibacter]QEM03870.1 hypothetical protein DIU31_010225 [Mucilaginibacter rubeus]QEM16481.1 hypothetical protein DIU38_010325 [Mucilaginibacter gossypii]QTE40752.1 hypothetical protein J3L19_17420 [Mucilaginibacter rubeus]QTE47354.1 hypothetical protein J3L21_17395 [Mucilaginibacter rubeus]QTE58747.1 hypothetical protein J3L23_09070 [Mucilaginibacter rubeus]